MIFAAMFPSPQMKKTAVLVFDGEESLFDIPCVTYGRRNDSVMQANRLF